MQGTLISQPDMESNPFYDYMTGEDMLFKVADNTCQGDPEDASRKIIQDFRSGRMGAIALQLAPETEEDRGQLQVPVGGSTSLSEWQSRDKVAVDVERQMQLERARVAMEMAKERGLELPPMIADPKKTENESPPHNNNIGKGLFDGW
jgi:hypothetical protein